MLKARDQLLGFIRGQTHTEVQRQLLAYHDFYRREGERFLDCFSEPGACLAEAAINKDQKEYGKYRTLPTFLAAACSVYVQQAAKLLAIGGQTGNIWRPSKVTVDVGERRRAYYENRAGRNTMHDVLEEAQAAFSVSMWIDP